MCPGPWVQVPWIKSEWALQAFAQSHLLQTPIGAPAPGKQNKTDNHSTCVRDPSHPVAGMRMPDKADGAYVP